MVELNQWWNRLFGNPEVEASIQKVQELDLYQIPADPCSHETLNKQVCLDHFKSARQAADLGELSPLESHLSATPFDERITDKLRYQAAKNKLVSDSRNWIKEIRLARKGYASWEQDIQILALLAAYLQKNSQLYSTYQEVFHEIAYWTYDRLIEAVFIESDHYIQLGNEGVEANVKKNMDYLKYVLAQAVDAKVLLKKDERALKQRWDFSQVQEEAKQAKNRNQCVGQLLEAWSLIIELREAPPIPKIDKKNKVSEADKQLREVGEYLFYSGKDLRQSYRDGKVTRYLHYHLEEQRNTARMALINENYAASLKQLNYLIHEIHRRYPQTQAFKSGLGKLWLETPVKK